MALRTFARALARALARAAARVAAVVLVAASATFALLHLAPGDPETAASGRAAFSAEARAALRARYGLDRPLPEQYARWLGAAARGDLGWSSTQQRPVRAVLADALPRSAALGGAALALALAGGVAVGAFAGWRPRHPVAQLLVGTAAALHAVPEFVLALALVSTLALRFAVFPAGGDADPAADAWLSPAARLADRLRHLALPALALALGWTAVIARHQRAALARVRAADWVRTARAKGVAEPRVALRHALPAALGPTLAVLGLTLPALASGAVVTEAVFAWPGLGLAAAQGVAGRDYPLVAGVAVAGSGAVALAAALAEALQGLADPRRRAAAGGAFGVR